MGYLRYVLGFPGVFFLGGTFVLDVLGGENQISGMMGLMNQIMVCVRIV